MKSLEEIKKMPGLLIAKLGEDGGAGQIFHGTKPWCSVIWSFGGGWEHVSIVPYSGKYPTWSDMCDIKDRFFNEEEVVVQYHPAKSEYVNVHPCCLHLWRPIHLDLPTPPTVMIGPKPGQTKSDTEKAVDELDRNIQKDRELKYLFEFAKGAIFSDGSDLQVLRCLWTAYCFHFDLNVDTQPYDTMLYRLWNIVGQNRSCTFENVDDLDSFLCAYMV